MDGPFYIHLEDPGFPEHPWPGVRRLGPYPTLEEATTQAVSDAAQGCGVALGVFHETESEKRYQGGRDGKAAVTRATIRQRGETIARKLHAAQAAAADQIRADIEAALPPGVGWEDLMLIARESQRRVGAMQTFPPRTYDAPAAEDE